MAILEGLAEKMLHTVHHDKPISHSNVTHCSSGISLTDETHFKYSMAVTGIFTLM